MSLQGGVEAAVTAGVCRYLFQVLTVMIDPEAAAEARLEAVFSFTDSLVTVRVELRRGVCLVTRAGSRGTVFVLELYQGLTNDETSGKMSHSFC